MATKVRMRCPGCGMLVDQERLNGVHDFEIIIHEIGSRGRGRIYNVYRKPDKIEGNAFVHFKMGIAVKFREIADRLESSLGDEFVDAEYVDEDGGDEEWRLESGPEVVLVPQVLLGEVTEAESMEVQESETVLKAEAELKETET